MGIQKAVLGSLAVVVFYNLLFFRVGLGIGVGLFFLLIHAYLFFTRNKHANLFPAITSSIVSILFGFFEGYRANGEVQFLNLLVALGATFIAVYFYRISWRDNLNLSHLLTIPLRVIGRSIIAAFSLILPKEEKTSHSSIPVGPILRGIIITIPIFLILLVLLTKADPIFQNLTTKLLSQSIERIILSTFLFGVLISWGLSVYTQVKERIEREIGGGKSYELGILGGSIAILFAVFIAVQFQYLFSQVGERQLGELGIKSLTYSEYVRKGFFELLIVSTIAGAVITYILNYLHRLSSNSKTILQVLTGLLTFETGMLLYSAFARLSLYADGHGLTRARIWGFLFLLWLLGVLIILFVRTVRKLSSEKIAYGVIGITLMVLLAMNIFNIDHLIATKYRPTVNNEIDYSYIALLSPDASESWEEIIQYIEKEVTELERVEKYTSEHRRRVDLAMTTTSRLVYTVEYLIDKYGTNEQMLDWHASKQDVTVDTMDEEFKQRLLKESSKQKWQEYNHSEALAFNIINDHFEQYLTLANLNYRVNTLWNRPVLEKEVIISPDRPQNPPVFR